jgi:hypothetical protein
VIDLLNLKLRGYVAPEDFEGSDAERIQKALDLAHKEDIAKVVLTGTYRADAPLTVPCGMHVVLDGATLYGDLQNEFIRNFSFEQDRIYIEGKNAEIIGDVRLCHTRHAVLESLRISGNVTVQISRDFRIEHVELTGTLTVARGCQNAIIQHVKCNDAVLAGADGGFDVPGRETILKNILLRDSEISNGVAAVAAADCGFLNLQIDGIRTEEGGVVLGTPDARLPAEQYKNLTIVDIDAPEGVVFHNDCLHAYVK